MSTLQLRNAFQKTESLKMSVLRGEKSAEAIVVVMTLATRFGLFSFADYGVVACDVSEVSIFM